jgi:hypothetical protein
LSAGCANRMLHGYDSFKNAGVSLGGPEVAAVTSAKPFMNTKSICAGEV